MQFPPVQQATADLSSSSKCSKSRILDKYTEILILKTAVYP